MFSRKYKKSRAKFKIAASEYQKLFGSHEPFKESYTIMQNHLLCLFTCIGMAVLFCLVFMLLISTGVWQIL